VPLVDATPLILRAAAEGVLPDPALWLDQWAEEHVVIPKGGAFSGPYRLAHTPYARRILQALSPDHTAGRVVAKIASQMLKTQVFICAALGWIDAAPANILALEPTDGLAKRLSARISKSIEACDKVKDKVAAPRSRDKRNTIDAKEFDGGTLYITTGGSDANLAEIPARYLFVDEVNREGYRTGATEGDRIKMAEARLTTYEGMSKAYFVSSPTKVGASEITKLFEQGTQEHYHVPCPHCGHLHELVLENFRWEIEEGTDDKVTRAWFVCPDCGAEIEESDKATMLPDETMGGRARWVATAPGDGETISVTLSAFYAPLGSIHWRRLAKELVQARAAKALGDKGPEEVFYNTRLGIDYDGGEITSTVRELMARAAAERLPPRVVPERGLVLTMYADTQPNRLEVTTEAWGPGMEHWTVDHQIIWGSPTDPPDTPGGVWQRLEELRRTPLPHASGALIRVSSYGIDSGGANTQDVYNYGSARESVGCLVTKGENLRGRPIIPSRPTLQDIDWQGRRVEKGVKLWRLGTDTAKDWLFNRLQVESGPGAAHWHSQTTEDFFEQLLVEKPQIRWHKGRAIREYVKPNGARNEILDCAVGNLALAHHLGLHKWSDADWRRLRENLARTLGPPPDAPTGAQPRARPPPARQPETPPPPPVAPPVQRAPAPAGRRVYSRGIGR
jgi:phage terminase large subunit GpA-like protein